MPCARSTPEVRAELVVQEYGHERLVGDVAAVLGELAGHGTHAVRDADHHVGRLLGRIAHGDQRSHLPAIGGRHDVRGLRALWAGKAVGAGDGGAQGQGHGQGK